MKIILNQYNLSADLFKWKIVSNNLKREKEKR